MTQQQNPQPPSQANQTPPTQSSQLKTKWGRKTEEFLEQLSEPVDVLGKRLMGNL